MVATQEELFFSRELSWIEFNARVLAEAMDSSNLLLDRLKFMGIVSSNLDEFFMVRVAGLDETDPSTCTVREKANDLSSKQNDYFSNVMISELEQSGIYRIPAQALTEKQLEFVKRFFFRELFPVLTPIAIYEERPTPVLVNLSLYMVFGLTALTPAARKTQYAVIEIPKNFPRMISLPADKGYQFLLIENLIALFAKELFSGYEIISQGLMRITRAAEIAVDEESDEDFSKVMVEALKKQRQNNIVRLEAFLEEDMLAFIQKKMEISPEKICRVTSWFDLKEISQFAFQPLFSELRRPVWKPAPFFKFEEPGEIWTTLKEKDVWVHHPYDSFDAVKYFIAAAASDPDVLAIKLTLYRIGQDSAIVRLLEKAAENGKRVTVLVELKARFDEEKNITWSRRLEDAGASVIYGVVGLKTHAKACLVVRREAEGIRRYAHLSTGNYNEKTANLYSDIGYFTGNAALTDDLTIFFNSVTGLSQPLTLSKVVIAPYGLRRRLKRLIQREAIRSSSDKPGLIMAKMNSLVDKEIIETLYKASSAGVRIKLHVRGVCCLRPGIKNLSENIEVRSTVDMFLEHSRITYFQNGGDEEIYLSSADWMPRNFDRRVEIMFPVEDKVIRDELKELMQLYFKDNTKSWRLMPDGTYEKVAPYNEKEFRVQEFFCAKSVEREKRFDKTLPRELKPQRPR